MGREMPTSPKRNLDLNRRKLLWIVGSSGLCLFFYILGSWQNSQTVTLEGTKVSASDCIGSNSSDSGLDFDAHHSSVRTNDGPSFQDTVFEPCDISYSEYTPCQDLKRSLKFDRDRLKYRERHCPNSNERLQCLVPAPPGYKNPFPWPKSRDFAWYANVPHKELTVEKAIQNWIQYEGDRFRFPGGGTMFPNGADAYINDISALISLTDGSIRTALDTGCGVASWGAYLLKQNILTMSFAPRDSHEAQVQFALERGIPAMIGVMASQRLPYPARSFDMAHCSRCLIPWKDHDGVYLIEVDRVLRPGGYWILSGPPVNWKIHWKGWQRAKEDLKEEMDAIEELGMKLCWKKVKENGNLAIWQKPWNHVECIDQHKQFSLPDICKGAEDADYAWYREMETCITPLPNVVKRDDISGGRLAKWPSRATAIPPRIARGTIPGITAETFNADTLLWAQRVAYYKSSIISPLGTGRYRNIMDMNSELGGFAAALVSDKVWVMNTVSPTSNENTLGVIFERGFIGTYQDWCEPFSTYPRTYDLIHASGVFSMYQDRCDVVDILLEMDRILRPEGAVIIRDDVNVINKLKRITNGMRWKSKLADHESGPFNTEKILIGVKSYWVGQWNSTKDNAD